MATLFNTKIFETYQGLLKTIDNAAITATLKELTDGSGNASGLYINTAGDLKVTNILEWGSLKDTGTGVTITRFVTSTDGIENFNNNTSIPTSAAVKTYVDAQFTIADLDFLGDTNTGTPVVDLDSQNFSVLGTTNEIITSGNAQTLTIGLPNSVIISGTFTGATFAGDLNGTINTATTAVTQTAGNNSTKVATTAYVDTLDAASDLDFSGDSGTGDVNLNTQTFAVTGVSGQIVTLANAQGLNLSFPTAGVILPDGSTAITQTAGDSSTKVATTSYVDTLDSASDLDFSGDSGTGDVNLNTEVLAVTGTANQIETTASGVGLSLAFPTQLIIPSNTTATTQTTGDNSTKIATTAYVDVLDAASDLDVTGDTGTTDVNLNTQNLNILGTSNQVTSTVTAQTATLSLPSSINVNSATATAWETARDLSLTGQATATLSNVDGALAVSGAVTLDNNSVTAKVLTGLPTPAASSVLATDSIVDGIGKLQSQINGLAGGLRFMGTWNVVTNSPPLSSGGGESASGSTTSTSADKLVDSAANFATVSVGDKVVNQVDGQTALVTNVDSSTILSLDADIMLTGESYTIDISPFLTQGHYYVVSVGGARTLNSVTNWSVGDWAIVGANNEWSILDHTDVEGTGTAGNIAKWASTGTIADSIIAESGTALTVTGSLATTSFLSSGGNFSVNTDKFTANGTTGAVAHLGNLAINTDVFTVNATSGNVEINGTTGNLDILGNFTLNTDKFTIAASTGNTSVGGTLESIGNFEVGVNKFTVNATSGNTVAAGTVTAPTFIGDLTGTVNATSILADGVTATTQSALNGSTKVATTAYADAAASAVPIGDYLPLIGGTLTGNLNITGGTAYGLNITTSGTQDVIKIDRAATSDNAITKYQTASADKWIVGLRNTGDDNFRFYSYGTSSDVLTINQADGNSTFAGNVIGKSIVVGPAGNLNDTTGVSGTLQFGNGNTAFVTGSADAYIYKNQSALGSLPVGSLTFQLRSDTTGGAFAFVGQQTPIPLLTINSSGDSTFAGNVGVGNSGTFDNPNSYSKVIEIAAASPVGLILNDTRDTHPMSIANEGAVMNLRYNTTSLLSLDGATGNSTFGGNVGIGGGTIEGKLSIDYTAAELPTSGTTSNSAIQVTSSLNNQLNLGLNTVSGDYGAYIQASDNNLAVPYPLNLQPNGGNVGIGTTSPDYKLEISGSIATNVTENVCRIEGGTWLNSGGITIESTGASSASDRVTTIYSIDNQNQDAPLAFGTGTTERMRIASDGSVRIGKSTNYSMSSPYLMIGNSANTNELILSNQGSTQLGGFDGSVIMSTGGSNNLLISSDNGYTAFGYGVSNGYTSYNEAMRIDSSGNVGIGTSVTDEAKLIVQASTEIATGGNYNAFGNLHVTTDTQGINNGGTISMGGLGRTTGPTEYFRYAQISGRAESASSGSTYGYMAFETTDGVTNLTTERMRITSGGIIEVRNGSTVGGEIKLSGADNDLTLNGARDQIIFQINGTPEYVMDNSQFYPESDNVISLGLSGSRFSTVYAANGVNTSDETLKENIKECDLGIDFIDSLKPKSYNLKDLKEDNDAYGKKRYGLIAQDILQTELKDSVFGKKDGEYGLSYNDLIAPMIKAIQELKAEVDLLKNKCNCKN